MNRIEVSAVTAVLHRSGLSAYKRIRRTVRRGYTARQMSAGRVAVHFAGCGASWREIEDTAETALAAAGFSISRPLSVSNGVLFVTV